MNTNSWIKVPESQRRWTLDLSKYTWLEFLIGSNFLGLYHWTRNRDQITRKEDFLIPNTVTMQDFTRSYFGKQDYQKPPVFSGLERELNNLYQNQEIVDAIMKLDHPNPKGKLPSGSKLERDVITAIHRLSAFIRLGEDLGLRVPEKIRGYSDVMQSDYGYRADDNMR